MYIDIAKGAYNYNIYIYTYIYIYMYRHMCIRFDRSTTDGCPFRLQRAVRFVNAHIGIVTNTIPYGSLLKLNYHVTPKPYSNYYDHYSMQGCIIGGCGSSRTWVRVNIRIHVHTRRHTHAHAQTHARTTYMCIYTCSISIRPTPVQAWYTNTYAFIYSCACT